MKNTEQSFCQLETLSNLLMQIKGAKIVSVPYDTRYHGIGIQIDDIDYMTILFERNGLCGVTYDVGGYRGNRTWRKTNCHRQGFKSNGDFNYEFRQRTEEEFCTAVVREINEIIL